MTVQDALSCLQCWLWMAATRSGEGSRRVISEDLLLLLHSYCCSMSKPLGVGQLLFVSSTPLYVGKLGCNTCCYTAGLATQTDVIMHTLTLLSLS